MTDEILPLKEVIEQTYEMAALRSRVDRDEANCGVNLAFL